MKIKGTPALNKTLQHQDLFPGWELLIKPSNFSYKHTRNWKRRFDPPKQRKLPWKHKLSPTDISSISMLDATLRVS